jgi:hypothetical protein
MAKKWIILVLFIGVILSQPLWEEDMWKRSLDKIATMFSLIEDNYYEEVDYRELAYASIKGMLPTLDPHSYFLDPTNLATLTEDYRGKYFGIGCLIQKHGELLKVISPIEGGPSYRLGILPNDVISQIDGERLCRSCEGKRAPRSPSSSCARGLTSPWNSPSNGRRSPWRASGTPLS